MSLLRFVGLMMMGAVPVLLLIARVAFGPTTRARLSVAVRYLGLGAGAVLLSFRDSGEVFRGVGTVLMAMAMFTPFPGTHSGFHDDGDPLPTQTRR
jgi:hypothetical protein